MLSWLTTNWYSVLLIAFWLLYFYVMQRNKKKDEKLECLALAIDSLSMELRNQGLLHHRRNQYYHREDIVISRCGKYFNRYKITVPSLGIAVEGDLFEETLDNVNDALEAHHEQTRLQNYERCASCKYAKYGDWLGIRCSKGLFEYGDSPDNCQEYTKGEPMEEVEEDE